MAQDTPDHAGHRKAFRAQLRDEAAFIDADPDPERAHDAAVAFGTLLADLVVEWAAVRARQVVRVRDSKALALAGLATVIRVSKARAGELVRLGLASTPPPPAADDNGRVPDE